MTDTGTSRGLVPIAIVGMAARMPGAGDLEQFWTNLRSGVDGIREVPAERWDWRAVGVPGSDLVAPRWGGFVDGLARFDADAFGLSHAQVEVMDPIQRLFLEVGRTALEHAGWAGAAARQAGVFVGTRSSSYPLELQARGGELRGRASIVGQSQNYVAAWLADRLDLRGPALVVDTACSSSLVAVSLAMDALRMGRCELALAGGVDLLLSPAAYRLLAQARVLSPSGRCRTFDARADGYVPGEGAGAVVLRRLPDALRDGDTIHAVLLAAAINNDGHTMGLTTPSADAQQHVIQQALALAGLASRELSYVEAHGTGTAIGDPIELRALTRALADASLRGTCGVGSVKSNVGHLHSAAGVAGLLKVALALRHGELPPTLHCEQPNPRFRFDDSPLYPVRECTRWDASVRHAGVSSFGFGGTNCHVVMRSAPPRELVRREARRWLFVVSAPGVASARELASRVADTLDAGADAGDVAFTLGVGRRLGPQRVAVVAEHGDAAAQQLRAAADTLDVAAAVRRPVVFMFPGQGTQSVGMCRDVFERHPAFRDALERCHEALRGVLPVGLIDLLYPARASVPLLQASLAQPALFSVQYALAQLWLDWGVRPALVMGHSFGEYVAACVAGGVALPDALALVHERGRLVESLSQPGAMAAIVASEHDVAAQIGAARDVSIAAINSASNTVIAGTEAGVARVAAGFRARGVRVVPLKISHAFHCPLIEPMVEPFERFCARLRFEPFAIPFVSNVSGAVREQPLEPAYMGQHLLQPVRFAAGMRTLWQAGHRVFLEVGPGDTLGKLGRAVCEELAGAGHGELLLLASWLRASGREGGRSQLLDSAAALLRAGVELDLQRVFAGEPGRRGPLPTTPLGGREYPITVAHELVSEPSASEPRWDTPSAVDRSAGVVEFRIDPSLVLVAEHRVEGRTILPGAALWWLAWVGASQLGPITALEQVVLVQPLVVEGHALVLQVRVEAGRVTLASRPAEGGSWREHARGRVSAALRELATCDATPPDPDAAVVEGAAIHAYLGSLGLQLGSALRWLVSVRCTSERVWAQLHAPSDAPTGLEPALLDAAIQSLAALRVREGGEAQPLFVPVGIESLALAGELPRRGSAFVSGIVSEGETTRCDVELRDDAGVRCALLRGVQLRAIKQAPQRGRLRLVFVDEPPPRGEPPTGTWWVLARRDRGGTALVESLARAGLRVHASWSDERPMSHEPLLERELDMLGAPLRGIVHALALGPETTCEEEHELGVATALALCRVLIRRGGQVPLWVVTTRGRAGVEPPLPERAALRAAMQVAYHEHPTLAGACLELERGEAELPALVRWLVAGDGRDLAIGPAGCTRPSVESSTASESSEPFVPSGVQLITGGAAGLGASWARWLAERFDVPLALVARRPLAEVQSLLDELRAHGRRVAYVAADVADAASLRAALEQLRAQLGRFGGVLHAAGVLRDAWLRDKTREQLEAVWSPKVRGALALARATADDPLRHFALCSSLASFTGNVGQFDYAGANAWLDAFALARRARGLPATSVAFSLIADAGMGADPRLLELARASGVRPLPMRTALEGLARALADDRGHALVADLDLDRFVLTRRRTSASVDTGTGMGRASVGAVAARLARRIATWIREHVAERLGKPSAELAEDRTFLELGLDSSALVELVRVLEQHAQVELYPTLLFEHQTPIALADHLAREHADAFARWLAGASADAGASVDAGARLDTRAQVEAPAQLGTPAPANGDRHEHLAAADIAIIGMAGRFPGARDLDEFWTNLREGVDAVREIPAERFDWRAWYDADVRAPGKTYCRWGGFLAGVDEFDPLHFNISPREAALMDPQQRLFLEVAWETLERAGYAGDALRGSDTGLFVGVTYNNYLEQMLRDGAEMSGYSGLGNCRAVVPNRTSFFFDWHGPSFIVDTLCSSSLVAIQLACESLRRGECAVAMAGGVNAVLGAEYFVFLSRMGTLSATGRCRTFDARADGFVPGEGVGALLLKPLARAQADGDSIHAVIRGGAVNHGGRSPSLSAPNPRAQAALLEQAIGRARVEVDSLRYVETHGTGTSLGDPIELSGLSEAFRRHTRRSQFCALGSLKSAIGHLEPAAGVAGVIKVALALEQGVIPPTLHFERPNPFIGFVGSPFVVAERAMPWPREATPRRAGVSAFGLGGANAHLILEQAPAPAQRPVEPEQPRLVVLSARTEAALRRNIERLRAALGRQPAPRVDDLAFTLACGRAALRVRAAFVVEGIDELRAALERELVIEQREVGPWVFVGSADASPAQQLRVALRLRGLGLVPQLVWLPDAAASIELAAALECEAAPELPTSGARVLLAEHLELADEPIAASGARATLELLAGAWRGGATLALAGMFEGGHARRIPLPTYAFERERHWYQPSETTTSTPTPLAEPDADLGRLIQAERWRELSEASPRASLMGEWLVIGADAAHRLGVVERLMQAGARVHVSEAEPAAVGRALERLARVSGIVQLASCDALGEPSSLAQLEHHVVRGLEGLLVLGKALVGTSTPPRTFVVTPAAGAFSLLGAATAAFARSLAIEAPALPLRIVRLDLADDPGAALIDELACTSGPIELARSGARRELRELVAARWPARREGQAWLQPGEPCLISGGAGGLGALVAHFVAERHGARPILLGRRASPSDALRRFDYHACDITDADALARTLAQIRREHGPLRAVIHCAGLTADAFVYNKRSAELAAVLAPKVQGTWLLDHLTREDPLRAFVGFSSLAGVTGNAGQSDYAAANAWMDAYLRGRSGPGRSLSIAWPLWRDAGLGDAAALRVAEATGLIPLAPADALALLSALLGAGGDAPVRPIVAELVPGARERLNARLAAVRELQPVEHASVDVEPRDHAAIVESLRTLLTDAIAAKLRLAPGRLPAAAPLADFGLDSFSINELVVELGARYRQPLHHAMFLEHGSVAALAEHMAATLGLPPDMREAIAANPREADASRPARERVSAPAIVVPMRVDGIAVIGMGCRFPHAGAPDDYWSLLQSGHDAVGPAPWSRWGTRAAADADAHAGAFLSDEWALGFDALRFGMTEDQAMLADPHQRLFLEVALEAVEDAGYGGASLRGSATGVFVGVRHSYYYSRFREQLAALIEARGDLEAYRAGVVGSLVNYVASRVSHLLDLRGPVLSLESACSSSLVALHLARRSLLAGDCEQALVGGVDLKLLPLAHELLGGMRALAADGRPRVFDVAASGFVPGEGAGAVLLKPLARALADRDHVRGVILGSACNNDGRAMGLTTPSIAAQIDVIDRALAEAEVGPDELGLIEAHGTGTPLGDPIEIKALSEVLRRTSRRSGVIGIGSAKSVIGHLDTAAGVAGLIKLLLALEHRTLPPTLHCERPNPRFGFESSPFFVVDRARAWPSAGRRLAALSSFGLGGTNVHAVVGEAPVVERTPAPARAELIVLAAHTRRSCERLRDAIVGRLDADPSARLDDIALTLAGRAPASHRIAIVADSLAQLRAALGDPSTSEPLACERLPSLAFVFPGQGRTAQGHAGALYATLEPFRACVDRCEASHRARFGESLLGALDGAAGRSARQLHCGSFMVQLATVELLAACGIRPDAVLGHSLGEYAAACVAGVLELDEGLALIAERAQLLDRHALPGAMLAVLAPVEQVRELLSGLEALVGVAADNGPSATTIAGTQAGIERCLVRLRERGIKALPLAATHAFHSPAMQPVVEPYAALLSERLRVRRAQLPWYSTVAGARVSSPLPLRHWADHTVRPVEFARAIAAARADGHTLMLELGPSGGLRRAIESIDATTEVLPTIDAGPDARRSVLECMAALVRRGATLEWGPLVAGSEARRVPLPTTPLERRRYWPADLEPAPAAKRGESPAHERVPPLAPLLDRRVVQGPGLAVFETLLRSDRDPVVRDHRVLGRCVLPAVAYWQLAVSAAEHALGSVRALRRVAIHEPLIVGDEPLACRVELRWEVGRRERASSACSFRVFSDERLHAEGTIELGEPQSVAAIDPAAIRARCPLTFDGRSTYADAYSRASGIVYGPLFRTLGSLQCSEQELLAELDTRDAIGDELHPGLLDGAMQAWAGFRLARAERAEAFLPMFVDEVELHGPLPASALSHVVLHTSLGADAEVIRGDTTLTTREGRVALSVRGFVMKRVTLARRVDAAPYGWTWAPLAASSPVLARGRWLVLSVATPLARALIDRLREVGAEPIVAQPGSLRRITATQLRGPLDDEAGLARVVAWASEAGPLAGVIDLLRVGEVDDALAEPALLHEAVERCMLDPLRLARALPHRDAAELRLWSCTSRAWQVVADDPPPAPAASLLWATARALAQEHPLLRWRVVDLPSEGSVAVEQAAALVELIARDPLDDALAWRSAGPEGAGAKWWARRLAPIPTHDPTPLVLPAAPLFVITGGGDGLGFAVAHWLARRCGAKLVLLGRSPTPTRPDAEAELRAAGAAEVLYRSVDIGELAALRGVADELASTLGRPFGLVHAAGVPGSVGRCIEKSEARLLAPLVPKVFGTRNLLEVFAGVRRVVLFSSVSAVGPGLARGLAEYAIANAFLEGVAAHERALGRDAIAIAWGPWAGIGMLQREGGVELMAERGFVPLEQDEGLAALEQALGLARASVVVAPHDPTRIRLASPISDSSEPRRVAPLAELPTASHDLAGSGDGDAVELDTYVEFLRAQVAAAVGVAPTRIDTRRRFMELGVDSLALLEFSKSLEQTYGLTLSPALYFEYPTIEALARHVESLLAERGGAASSVTPTPAPRDASELRSRLQHFMDRQIVVRWRLRGPLELGRLEQALARVVAHHELLRAEVEVEGDEQTLVIRPVAEREPPSIPLVVLPDAADAAAAVLEAAEARELVTHVRGWPQLRVTAFRCSPTDHVLLVSINHTICDGYSLAALLEPQLRAAYRASLAGDEPPLPPASLRWADWLHFRAQQRTTAGHRRAQEHWRAVYREPLPDPALPADFPATPDRSTLVDNLVRSLGTATTRALREHAASHGASLYVLTLSLLARRLYLWSGQADRVIGMPSANRHLPLPGITALFGCVVEVLPLRIRVVPREPFAELLARVRATADTAMTHMDYACDAFTTPAISFTFPHFGEPPAREPEPLSWQLEQVRNEIGNDDLELILLATIVHEAAGENLTLSWTWQRSRFRAATLERLAAALERDIAALLRGDSLDCVEREEART